MDSGETLGRDAELAERVRGAVIWRSGSQIIGQVVTWACTFVVIRMLDPSDYGLMSYDPAFTNTASTKSAITYLDGDEGKLSVMRTRY